MKDKIKEYWDERATTSDNKNITTNDIWLRELEIKNLINILNKIKIPQKAKILDIGCGDGYSTIILAEKFPDTLFQGIDFSKNMIEKASLSLKDKKIKNINFQVGNVLEVNKKFNKDFDIVITDRCLINLKTVELQEEALSKISKIIKDDGYYIGIENFHEGQNEFNNARKEMKLSEIPVRWHNLFFKENEFKKIVNDNFKIVDIKNFSSSYYFATRIIYSKMCKMKGVEPDYNHEIHRLAVDLPNFGNFSPIKCVILQKRGKHYE